MDLEGFGLLDSILKAETALDPPEVEELEEINAGESSVSRGETGKQMAVLVTATPAPGSATQQHLASEKGPRTA